MTGVGGRILDLLANKGTQCRREIIELLGLTLGTFTGTIDRLRAAGMAMLTDEKGVNLKGGWTPRKWAITQKALEQRREPIVAVIGSKVHRFLDDGYTPLPVSKESDNAG